jgi:hypothetical protein
LTSQLCVRTKTPSFWTRPVHGSRLGGCTISWELQTLIIRSIIDLHSHVGVMSLPRLSGADDTNSLKGLTMPWLRSLDGLNTHDEAYRLAISGGVTTANVLPGSANAIGASLCGRAGHS